MTRRDAEAMPQITYYGSGIGSDPGLMSFGDGMTGAGLATKGQRSPVDARLDSADFTARSGRGICFPRWKLRARRRGTNPHFISCQSSVLTRTSSKISLFGFSRGACELYSTRIQLELSLTLVSRHRENGCEIGRAHV